MAVFAERANQAAKALSATTLDYTNASLIYYQQGLSDAEVQARTDVTIKMANVSRQSAEEVSDQMTAIWNNFAEGSENLEYYADVITALGAATASSSEEISTGLEKFAAVSKTVGLSYEYATAALATITATTRQSADTVGTGLRTLFSRLESLKLGETLEDGVDLNKYSKALQTVGVDILDATGNLKDMDTILDETAARWQNLDQAQKMAFASTVGGVRQYTNLIALMDNWDFMQQNLETARGSEGTVSKQQEIYAESWEAARDRVTAALEEIYNKLLNDDGFITLLNTGEKFIGFISKIIDSLGGVQGVIFLIANVLTTMYQGEIANGIDRFVDNLKLKWGKTKEEVVKYKAELNQSYKEMAQNSNTTGTDTVIKAQEMYREKREAIEKLGLKINENDDASLQKSLDLLDVLNEQLSTLEQISQEKQRDYENNVNAISGKIEGNISIQGKEENNEELIKAKEREKEIDKQLLELEQKKQSLRSSKSIKKNNANIKALQDEKKQLGENIIALKQKQQSENQAMKQAQKNFLETSDKLKEQQTEYNKLLQTRTNFNNIKDDGERLKAMQEYLDALKQQHPELASVIGETNNLEQAEEALNRVIAEMGNNVSSSVSALYEYGHTLDLTDEDIKEIVSSSTSAAAAMAAMEQKSKQLKGGLEGFGEQLDGANVQTVKTSQVIAKGVSALSSFGMALSSIKAMGSMIESGDIVSLEGFIQLTMTLGTVMNAVASINEFYNLIKDKQAAAEIASAAATSADTVAKGAQTAATGAATAAQWSLTAAFYASPIGWFAAIIAVAVTALTALAYALYKAATAESDEQKEAKRAAEAAKDLENAYRETQEELDNLLSAKNKYDDAIKALEKCTQGTQAWRDAIKEVNASATELLQKYPQLMAMQGAVKTENGIITIDPEAIETLVTAQQQIVNSFQYSSILAGAYADVAKNRLTASELNDNADQWGIDGTQYGFNKNMAPLRKLIDDNYQTLKDLPAKEFNEAVVNLIDGNKELKDQFLADSVDVEDAQFKMHEYVETWSTEMQSYAKGVSDLADSTELAKNKMIAAAEALSVIAPELEGYSAAEKAVIADALASEQEELFNKIYKQDNGIRVRFSQSDKAPEEAVEYAKEWLKATGKNWTLQENLVQGTDKNRTFAFYDSEGKEVNIGWKTIANEIAYSRVNTEENIKKLLDENKELLDKFEQNKAVNEFAGSGNLKGMTFSEISQLSSEMGEQDALSFLTEKLGGEEALTQAAKALGYNTGEEFAEAFAEEKFNVVQGWANVDLSQIGYDWGKNLSLDTASALSANLKTINFSAVGKDGAETYIEGLNSILSKVSSDDYEKVLSELNNVKWDDWNAFEKQVIPILQRYGYELNNDSGEFDEFITNMRYVGVATPDFSDLVFNLTEVSKILQELDFGDTLDDEDYQTLLKYNNELEKFFILQADGSRKFIGDSHQILDALRKQVAEEKQELEQRSQWQQTFLQVRGSSHDWTNAEELKGTGASAMRAFAYGGSGQQIAESIGYNAEDLRLWAANPEQYTNEINAFYEAISKEIGKNYVELTEQQNELLASSTTSFYDLISIREDVGEDAFNKQVQVLKDGYFESAEGLDDLLGKFAEIEQLADQGITLNSKEKQEALLNLAEQFENASAEAEKYKEIITELAHAGESGEGNKALEEAEDNLKAAIRAGEAAEKYSLDAKVIEKQAKEIRELNSDLNMSAEVSTKLAIANERMNKGVKALHDNFKDWRKTLQTADKTSMDYAEAVVNVEDAVRDLIAAHDDWELPDDFLESPENLDLIGEAAEGDEIAINQLGNKLAEASVRAMEFNESIADAYNEAFGANITTTSFEEAQNVVINGIQKIYENLEALNNGTMTLDQVMGDMGDSWVAGLNQMALATGMSVEEMNSLLNQIGVQAKVTTVSVPQTMEVPTYDEYSQWVDGGNKQATYNTPEGETITYDIPQYHRRTWTVPGPAYTVEGYQQVAQIGTVEGDNAPPKIEHISFTGVGGTANRGSSNRGGGVSPSSTSGGDKTSSSSTPKKETKEKKNPTDEKERYHIINSQIEQQTTKLDRLSRAKDRAFGTQRQKEYQKEIQNLKNLGKMYEEHLRQSTDYLATDKAALMKWGAIISDKDGSVLNYDALVQAQVDAYNKAVEKYNNSAQTDADKEALKAAEDAFKQFQDDLKQYEETLGQYNEDIDNYVDNMIQQYDTMREKTSDAIEFKLQYDDDVLDFIDRLIDRLDDWNDSIFNAIDKIGKLNDKMGALFDKETTLQTGVNETLQHFLMDYKEYDEFGNVSYSTGLSSSQAQAFIDRFNSGNLNSTDLEMLSHMPEEDYNLIRDYIQQQQDLEDQMRETANQVVESVQDQWDKAKDELAEAAKPIASAAEALDNYTQIIDIVGADYLGITSELAEYLDQATIDVAHEATAAAKATMESLAAQRDEIQKLYDNAIADGDGEMAEKYRKQLQGINDDVQSATEEFHQKWQEELRSIREAFEETVDRVKDDMLDAFAGPNNTWREFKDSFDYAKEAADRFVPEYKEIYELSKLNRDINKSIDDTDNVKNKEALRNLQKEINKLEEKSGELSQYDLDNARRKYELELARLALEEASTMKDTVRLSKDSEGNWSYIYTADQEDVAAAEQNYEDKLYAMQEANANYIDDLQDQMVQAEEAYADKVAEIMKDNTISEEQRQALLLAARQQFDETMDYYSGQLQTTMDNNKDLYDDDWTWYANYTANKAEMEAESGENFKQNLGYRLGDLENYVTDFNNTALGALTGFNTLDGYNQNITISTDNGEKAMSAAWQRWDQNTKRAMEGAGTSVEGFADDMKNDIDNTIVPKAQEAAKAVEQMGLDMAEYMKGVVNAADEWRKQWNDKLQEIINKNDAATKSMEALSKMASQLNTDVIGATTAIEKEMEKAVSSVGAAAGQMASALAAAKAAQADLNNTNNWGSGNGDANKKIPSNGSGGGGDSGGSRGCFVPGTKILMASGLEKNIEDIILGEKVIAYNEALNKFEFRTVVQIHARVGYNKIAKIELSNGKTLELTLGHPIYTLDGWQSLDIENSLDEHDTVATYLTTDSIVCGFNELYSIKNISIYEVPNDFVVYCLGTEDVHTFIANGVIAHNAKVSAFSSMMRMATGGYTGAFDNPTEGKLAVLHQKELVLNESDTANILSAVDMVRSLSQTIDTFANNSQFALGNLSAGYTISQKGDTLQQEVHITAEFPNAQDRNEIEAAFETLINQASQYANRKNI